MKLYEVLDTTGINAVCLYDNSCNAVEEKFNTGMDVPEQYLNCEVKRITALDGFILGVQLFI